MDQSAASLSLAQVSVNTMSSVTLMKRTGAMSQNAASSLAQVSVNTMSSVTIMKRTGAKAKTSSDHTYRNQYSRNHKNFFPKDEQIDFSVNDVSFEKVETKLSQRSSEETKPKKEPNWSENDVNFTSFNPDKKTCEVEKCFKNDMFIQPFNYFTIPPPPIPSYSSNEFDVNLNANANFMLESKNKGGDDNSHFRFDRDGGQGQYQSTTFYSLEDQLQDLSWSSENMTSISDSLGSLDLASRSYDASEDSSMDNEVDIDKDEELNKFVNSIIED